MYFSTNKIFLAVLYNITQYIVGFLLKIIALFNDKIKKGVEGRSMTFRILGEQLAAGERMLWFHCASLGEYEQGLPIFKKLRESHPNHKIVLSFFSPSGYEIRKNSPIADVVVYLPLDTPANAQRFISLVHPELTVFVKYDIWPNYLKAVKQHGLSAILISAAFRKEQSYFQFYGGILRSALATFDHIFVQNDHSKALLNSIGITTVTVAGDTRYDRVSDQLLQDNRLSYIDEFIDHALCVVIGSSWPEDESLFVEFINSAAADGVKFIIAPHNNNTARMHQFADRLQRKSVFYSERDDQKLSDCDVFMVDTIGLLSKIYSYADIAYVGGGMGNTGLHNILEPAVFGVPIIIGKNYKKFPEAHQMIANGGVIAISNSAELCTSLKELLNNQSKREHLGQLNAEFIRRNRGAITRIMDYFGR